MNVRKECDDMADITAIILTRNEKDYIETCINSLKPIVKRVVVVDSFSDDNTVELAKSCGAEVYQHEFYNYAKQYKYAVKIAEVKTKWIFRIDADEYLTKESAKEIENLCNKNDETDVNGIMIRFYQVFMGKALKHGGAYPWKKLSLYKTGVGDIEDRNMDEHIILTSGKIVEAKKDSVHDCYRGMDFFVKKRAWYSTREAMDYFEQKKIHSKNSSLKTLVKMNVYYKLPIGFRAWLFYIYTYYFRLGFLDGKVGRIYAFMHAYWYRFLVDTKIYEHERLGGKFKSTGALK